MTQDPLHGLLDKRTLISALRTGFRADSLAQCIEILHRPSGSSSAGSPTSTPRKPPLPTPRRERDR
jgi:hypothetical protein